MFDDVVTIFNHYIDDLENDKWHKTVLTDCMWRKKTIKTVANNKIEIANTISLTVPLRDGYVSPKEYARTHSDDCFTFDCENNLDIIVLGEVVQEVTSDYTIADIRKDYDSVATIIAVNDNTLVDELRHWKVTGV